jgi:hypothetical protein
MITKMLRGLAYVSIALAGCDEAFDLEHLTPSEPSCSESAIRDDFAMGPPCVGWGNRFTDGSGIVVVDSHLAITTSGTLGYGTCTAIQPVALPASGIFIEVSQLQGDAWFGIKTATDRLYIYAGYGTLRFGTRDNNFATATWDAASMRWWRLRPDAERDMYVAEYAPDGETWSEFGLALPWALDEPTRLTIGAGIADQTTPQTSTFEGVNVCP